MKLITRKYLQEVIDLIGTTDIKVITGVRRSGKSELMEDFERYIKKNIENVNVIKINFNMLKFEELKNYRKLNDYIEGKYEEKKHNFLLIDEVQMCKNFETTINSLYESKKYDIYITGSNAFLTSSDLATLFTGRSYEIKIYPFSFQEFQEYYGYNDMDVAFDEFVFKGGMAGSYQYGTQEQKYNYISEIFNALIVRDIETKYKIRYKDILSKLCDFLIDNISNITSARKIANEFKTTGLDVDQKTINSYINYLCNAFLFYKVRRFDIQGKRYLSYQDKYYLVDIGFKFAKLGIKNINYGRIYENIVAIELLRRGYEVYVGVLYEKEIDFVAIKPNEKIYIQVSDNISEELTFQREISPLLRIRDGYQKMIIARTKHDEYTHEGIRIIDIARWLLEGN